MEYIPNPDTPPNNKRKYATVSGIVVTIFIALCLIFAPDQFFRFLQILYFFG